MTQVIFGRTPLWTAKDGQGPNSENSVGFGASLQQGFVLTAAIRKYGAMYHGLPLPLPKAFACQHPGPAEVFAIVRGFASVSDARMILNSPQYNDEAPGVIPLQHGAVHNGLVWRIDSQANGGMQEYLFKWIRNSDLTQVSVVGCRLSLPGARAVALQSGSHG
ncbi:MAG TPA: hypothetical protein VGS19_24905 [Streptosporangiaceae bacterium]|nr:hypothetical protein [Streptosporangiaceae bacterium]